MHLIDIVKNLSNSVDALLDPVEKSPVLFCAFNSGSQSMVNMSLIYEEVSVEAGGRWISAEDGLFTVPRDGIYQLSFSAWTRTCGRFSLCSPTLLVLEKNGRQLRTYSTGASTERQNDQEAVRDFVVLTLATFYYFSP